MNRLDLLLPFSLTPPELAAGLQRELNTPALAMLLGRGSQTAGHANDEFARALPHELWLSSPTDITQTSTDNSPPLASRLAGNSGQPVEAGFWFILQPFHMHIARDHLVLADPRQLQITQAESRTLFETAHTLVEEAGKTLLYVSPSIWLLRADDWRDLRTSTPDAACGHNVDIWTPQGERARDWRRLQNEIQMHWHDHPVNDERALRGLKPLNSVWLWGGAAADDAALPRFAQVFSASPHITPLLAALDAKPAASFSDLSDASQAVIVLDGLSEAALAEDWAEWIARLNEMETRWFAPLLAELQSGKRKQVCITLSHHAMLKSIAVSSNSLRKFWKKPSLAALAA